MVKWGQLLRKKEASLAAEDGVAETSQRPAQGELGRLLRETRQEQDVDLEEIEQQTRIRAKYLLALEEAKYDELPTPGHIHGFLRNYAVYLGLDLEEVEALYARDRAARPFFEPKIFHPKNIALIPKKPMFKADLILALVVVLVVTAVGWAFWQYGWPIIRPQFIAAPTPTPTATATLAASGATSTSAPPAQVSRPSATPTAEPSSPAATDTPPPATATPTTEPTAEPTGTPTPEPTATPTLDAPLTIATPTAAPTATPTPTPTRTEGVLVQIKVVDRVWLQVTVDDRQLPGELLEVGAERDWEGTDVIYMICGNAGGVEVIVNGQELGVLGERAQVVERMWGPEGEITPTPEA